MSGKKQQNIFLLLLLFSFFILIKSQTQAPIIVFPVDSNINQYCSKNAYYFEFKVQFSQALDKVIPFEMTIPLPNRLPFKCVIDGPNTKILCFHSFSNFVWSLSDNTRIELPYSFPNIEGIRWDYDSFLRKIYRYLWRAQGNCGLEFEVLSNQQPNVNRQIKNDMNQGKEKKNDIIGNVEEIFEGYCHSSKYDFSFYLRMKMNEGEIIDELKTAKESKKKAKINLLHNIYVPVLLGEKRKKGITSFRKDYEYKYAICKYESDITQDNFDDADGIKFECHLPINRYIRFQGPLQIKPFTDFVYVSKTDISGKTSTNLISVEFDILSSSVVEKTDVNTIEEYTEELKIEEKPLPSNNQQKQTPSQVTPEPSNKEVTPEPSTNEVTPESSKKEVTPEASKKNLRNLQMQTNIKEPNFLILDSNLNVYICPDNPILTIQNYNDGIGFGGINTSGSKYLFLLYGYLDNGYDYVNDTLTLLDITKEEIRFYLKITDNLEDPDNRKKAVKCTIPSGTSINKNVLIEVKCIGSRARLENTNNTDLVLNWNLEENNNFENIIVRWPYDLTKKKHIYFYNVQGLSVKKDDYGCFENKFYFYLYVYDLKAEPKISFNLPLSNPKNTEAVCRLYNSVTFKCVIDLRLKKLSKGTKVTLSNQIREYLPSKEQNIVLYYVNNNTSSSDLDFQLPVQEQCGDNVIIGALKDVGYTYLQVIIIIICVIAGVCLCVFGVAFCCIYEITHRNRKGEHYKFKEEKEIPNTSVSQTNPPVK